MRRAGAAVDEPTIRGRRAQIDLAAGPFAAKAPRCTCSTEYDLLRTLVRNRGRLLTACSAAHGGCGARSTPTTRRYCARMWRTCAARSSRRGARRFIRTDPGVDYRFAAWPAFTTS